MASTQRHQLQLQTTYGRVCAQMTATSSPQSQDARGLISGKRKAGATKVSQSREEGRLGGDLGLRVRCWCDSLSPSEEAE